MAERRRKLHGVPKHVRGQFDFEDREPAAALTASLGTEGEFQEIDGLLVQRFAQPADGGYDTVELNPSTRTVRLLLDGALHNTQGAAEWHWQDENRVSSWWLHGQQVDQIAVARLSSGQPEAFDADVETGWLSTAEGIEKAVASAGGDSDAQDTVLNICSVLDHPVTDDEVMENPETAAEALGAARAARAARKAMLQAILDDRDWRLAISEVRGEVGPFIESVSAH